MKKLLLIGLLSIFPVVAQGKSTRTVPDNIVQQAKSELVPVFCEKGKVGAEEVVSACYLNNTQGEGLAKCMQEDAALVIFDNQMNDMIKSQFGKDIGEREGFLSEPAIAMREKLYFLPNFKTMRNAMLYFDRGNREIVSAMAKQCGNH